MDKRKLPAIAWDSVSAIRSIDLSPDGTRMASGSEDSLVRVQDVRSGAAVVHLLEKHTGSVLSVAFSPDNTRIISGSRDRTVIIWDADNGTLCAGPLRGHTDWVHSVAFSFDNIHIASGSGDRTIRVWDLGSETFRAKLLRGHGSAVYSVAFSSNGERIVSSSEDQTVRTWDVPTGTLIGNPLKMHTAGVCSAAFSPDETFIVSGCWEGTICIWDTHSRDLVAGPIAGHTSMVLSIKFLPNSGYFATGSLDRTIRIWDVRDGTQIGAPLQGHAGPVTSMLFTTNGAHLISGSSDGTVRVWDTPRAIYSPVFSRKPPHRYSSSAIATGGFGNMWRGVLRDGTVVAIKCLRLHLLLEGDIESMKRAVREICHWSKASHVNVQKLAGIIMFQGQIGMVSAWMGNGNLKQYIRNHSDVDRYQQCVQVVTGIAYLHSIGMVHGDIKALNILVSHEGIVKINDFDCSILWDTTLRFSETMKVGGGTLRWMAPELFQNQEDQDAVSPVARNEQTDVYALGMTMLEIISGRVPYSEYNLEMSIYRAIDRRQFPRRPKELLPEQDARAERMWALLLKCWNHDPAARPDASSVLQSLQTFAV